MAQVKFYGLKEHLDAARDGLSDAAHPCVVEALSLPEDKRFHRFVGLEPSESRYPPGRSERYTIIEIGTFETPRHNRGIRGAPADELGPDYKVEV